MRIPSVLLVLLFAALLGACSSDPVDNASPDQTPQASATPTASPPAEPTRTPIKSSGSSSSEDYVLQVVPWFQSFAVSGGSASTSNDLLADSAEYAAYRQQAKETWDGARGLIDSLTPPEACVEFHSAWIVAAAAAADLYAAESILLAATDADISGARDEIADAEDAGSAALRATTAMTEPWLDCVDAAGF